MADQRYIIRVANTDLDGKKHIGVALTKVKGVNTSFAHAICEIAGIETSRKAGDLSDAEEKQLNELVKNPQGIPSWMLNRRNDPETGEDGHLVGPDVAFVRDNDIKAERKLKTYKGQRHAHGLPVRGQRTQSNFRRHRKKQVSKRR